MTDIIWGNGSQVISGDSFVLKVTHRKNGNKSDYSDSEKIRITDADLPGLPDEQKDWAPNTLLGCIKDAFLKCEVDSRDDGGVILAKVSHSGVGGY